MLQLRSLTYLLHSFDALPLALSQEDGIIFINFAILCYFRCNAEFLFLGGKLDSSGSPGVVAKATILATSVERPYLLRSELILVLDNQFLVTLSPGDIHEIIFKWVLFASIVKVYLCSDSHKKQQAKWKILGHRD